MSFRDRGGVLDASGWSGWSPPAAASGSDLRRATTAIVLAAGAGRRLRATTRNWSLPKPLTTVAGAPPLLVRTLCALSGQGVTIAANVLRVGEHLARVAA